MPNYFTDLPENYEEVKVIDAKDKKTILNMNLVGILIMLVSIVPLIIIKRVDLGEIEPIQMLIALGIYLVGMIIYVILHELTHGLVYKVMTKQKLTFGMTLTCAFCGVPNIYVTKRTALYSILAPFVVFTIIFLPIILILPASLYNLAIILIFGTHTSGCVGDLYGTIVLSRLKGDILMNDTGPTQTFYKKID